LYLPAIAKKQRSVIYEKEIRYLLFNLVELADSSFNILPFQVNSLHPNTNEKLYTYPRILSWDVNARRNSHVKLQQMFITIKFCN
jgi:hypothetical protein